MYPKKSQGTIDAILIQRKHVYHSDPTPPDEHNDVIFKLTFDQIREATKDSNDTFGLPLLFTTMLTKLFLLTLGVLATFNITFVSALAVKRRSPNPVIVGNLNTNAKRFAAGLSPLPPVKRWAPSKVDSTLYCYKFPLRRSDIS